MSAETDRLWLASAIQVSRQSPPSPDRYAVGAVVVDRDGTVLATGYTGEGDPYDHAEEVALRKLAGVDLARATLYTSLEPCTARSSRPLTCTDLILAAGVRRVVFALREPPVFADCDGVAMLRRAGVEVVEVVDLAHVVGEVNAHVLAVAPSL